MKNAERPNLAWPFHHSPIFHTPKGIPYLKGPGAIVVGQTATNFDHMDEFLEPFGFTTYLDDPDDLPQGEELVKVGGQLCYMSFGEQRTKNVDAPRYFNNIKAQRHGSVTEHAQLSMVIYGVSRSLTHELVRHRAGTAFSQLSQRYVSGRLLRFVEREEYQKDEVLHDRFEKRIDFLAEEYDFIAERLYARQLAGDPQMSDEHKTGLRKKVNQAARSCLPNEAETALLFTGNVRALRHILEMRGAGGAEPEIRALALLCLKMMKEVWPNLTDDFYLVDLIDGSQAIGVRHSKI
ncbi:MAG: FAD-dependent thymidylate synthase [Patescibacteria group bacterium]